MTATLTVLSLFSGIGGLDRVHDPDAAVLRGVTGSRIREKP